MLQKWNERCERWASQETSSVKVKLHARGDRLYQKCTGHVQAIDYLQNDICRQRPQKDTLCGRICRLLERNERKVQFSCLLTRRSMIQTDKKGPTDAQRRRCADVAVVLCTDRLIRPAHYFLLRVCKIELKRFTACRCIRRKRSTCANVSV